MEIISKQLERIATSLESIAKSLNQNFNLEVSANQNDTTTTQNNFKTHTPIKHEEELFILTTNIYLDETKRKSAENMKRKSAVKVSQDLINMQIRFLSKYLPQNQISQYANGVLSISKDSKPIALIRFYTDLGFNRGNHWKDDILNIIDKANELNISHENIFVIVLSNRNGLDNQHVCSTLNFDISNKDILDEANIHYLQKYCNLYIDSFNTILPKPNKQLFFLATYLHPNVIANEIFNDNNTIDLTSYPWLSYPLRDIIAYIQHF